MDLVCEAREALPRLAWLARLREGRAEARVVHGPWVEARDRFFVEGAWDGEFAEAGFADSLMFMGSGGIAEEQSVLFCGASHPLERLFLLRDGPDLFVSPSLVFLLRASGARTDPAYVPYQADLLGFQGGLDRHVGRLPLADGRSVTVIHFRNVRVDAGLGITVWRKPEAPRFHDFADYEAFLAGGLRRFSENAGSPRRRITYTPLATVSSGYDSAACAALSVEIGCKEAVTLRSARPSRPDGIEPDDSGVEVARALGLTAREYDRNAYRSLDSLPEAEFVACGDLGQDLPMVAMEDALPRRFVLTGEHGDVLWSRDVRRFGRTARDFVRSECSGCSVQEFRLRVGFAHLCLACVAATAIPDLKRISRSPEMRPWTLGTRYDRPIARRLAEERGVPRKLFGQSKKAVTVLLARGPELRALMGPASYASFQAFLREHASERSRAVQAGYTLLFRMYRLYLLAFRRVNRVLSRLGAPPVPCPIPARFRHPPGAPSFLFHWGVETIGGRYGDGGPRPDPSPVRTGG